VDNTFRFDNSKRETANGCLALYNLKYNVGLQSQFGSTSLRYGSAFHEAMDGFYSAVKRFGWNEKELCMQAAILSAKAAWEEERNQDLLFREDFKNFNNLMSALMQYWGHFQHDSQILEIIEAERYFAVNMAVTNKERGLYGIPREYDIIFTGIIDLEILLSDRYWLLDFKTSARDLSYIASQNERSFQFKGYTYAGSRELRSVPEGMLVLYHQINARKSVKTGDYGNLTIDFKRVPYIYTEWEIAKWRESFLETAGRALRANENEHWPQQDDRCFKYGRCEFLELCKNEEPINLENPPDGFNIAEPWDPKTSYEAKQLRRKAILDSLAEKEATDGNPES
jgi:hypothetical protein